ncbi:COX15-CtaA-domain-containing protein [Auriculariales sp. MPI-PUGE-AT-0066]|nr:COX15-CtaA-domain-containing protein [Auriculariales sp. MPI-PUGE-AT-0066]
MVLNVCAAAARLAKRSPFVVGVPRPPFLASSRISAHPIRCGFARPPVHALGLARLFSGTSSASDAQKAQPLLQTSQSPLKHLARRFFSNNAALAAPRFFSSNATLADDGVTAGEEAEPAVPPRSVGWWLLASAGLVYAVVVVGGLTRLTESGLSITEWKPITGVIPPMSDAAWGEEFAKYKNSPEFAQLNSRMNIDDFKRIFYMEWSHRMLGRLIGISMLVPYAFFLARKQLPRPYPGMIGGFIALVGAQGAMGWYMVKSGLHDDLFAEGAVPRVSQYRLAAHLGLAVVLYAGMFHAGLRVLWDNAYVKTGQWSLLAGDKALQAIKASQLSRVAAFRRNIWIVTGMVLVTAISGAFVAGLDAGLVYNEFPTMGDGFAPPMKELFDSAYAKRSDGLDMWRNLFENPSTVQLNHRVLAMSTYAAACALYFSSFRPALRVLLPPLTQRLGTALFFFANAQVFLGIGTLLYLVPVHMAATHQAGSIALLTTILALGMSVRAPSRAAQLLRQNPLLRKH